MRNQARQQYGFSLVELSVVLVVIGLLVAAVTVGRDVQRNARYQSLANEFVQAWAVAYESYVDRTGVVPGDNPQQPTRQVNAGSDALCGEGLLNTMLAAGVQLPGGRAEGAQDRYAYLDANGNPQEARLCFLNQNWSVPGASVGEYQVRQRNVMVLEGLTPELARYLDRYFDGQADARFGDFREAQYAASTDSQPREWSLDSRQSMGGQTSQGDEFQQAVLSARIRMSR